MEKEELILEFIKSKEYVPMKAKELAIIFNVQKENMDEFISSSGDNYEMAVSGLSEQIAAQQTLRSQTLGQ